MKVHSYPSLKDRLISKIQRLESLIDTNISTYEELNELSIKDLEFIFKGWKETLKIMDEQNITFEQYCIEYSLNIKE